MANIKITDLGTIANPVSTDVLPIVDVIGDVTNKISIEELLKNAAAGTAAAPGIAFDGDPDTGVYNSGTNALAFSTGGTGRLFIDSSGNVGVGTSTPNYLLDVEKADAGARINALTGNSSVYLTCSDNAGISTLFLGDAASPTTGQIKYRNSGDSLAFEVNGSERIRVTSSGNVGIRTSAPTYALDISSTDANQLRIRGTADNPLIMDATDSGPSYVSVLRAGTRVAYYGFGGSGNDFYLINETSTGNIVLGTNSTERFRIDSSGNVGVGLTPTAKFHVAGTIQSSVGSHTAQMYSDGGASFFTSVGAYPSVFYTNGSERLRIDSSGRVGIGNSSPTQELCVRSTAGTEADILLEGDNGASGGLTVFHNASDCGLWNSSNTSMRFATNGTERFRIGPAGQFGLSGANYGTSGQVLTSNGSASAPTWQTPSGGGGGLYDDYAIFQHTTASGTSGGATTATTWTTRPFNTTVVSQTWASLSSSQITLSAGTYSIEWLEVIFNSRDAQGRFRNVTDGTTAALGVVHRHTENNAGGGYGKVTIASSKVFELQHYAAAGDTDGLGRDISSGENNVFATIKITKHV